MFRSFKKLNVKAVSLLEYVLVMTIVMAGIITAGRFAYLGWYAHMKKLDAEKNHSFSETRVKPPPFQGDWDSGGCTGVVYDCCDVPPCCGISGCDPQEECISIEKGDPYGCKPDVVTCAVNNSCCTTPAPTPYCADEAPPAWGITCDYGHRVMEKYCGFDPDPIYECSAEIDPSCVDACLGEPDANSTLCEDDDIEVPPGTYFSLVLNRASCTETRKCEAYCDPPYWLDYNKCINCGTQRTKSGNTCHCTAHGGCPWGRKAVAPMCHTCPRGTAPYAGAAFHHRGRHYRATVAAHGPNNATNQWCSHSQVHRGQSGKGTCQSTTFHYFAWCLPTDKSDPSKWKPDKTCKFKILVDYKIQGAACPSDYHTLQRWGLNLGGNHCVKYEHWAPFLNEDSQGSPPCLFSNVVGGIFTGYWSSGANHGTYIPVPQINPRYGNFFTWKPLFESASGNAHCTGSRSRMRNLTCRLSKPGELVPAGWSNSNCPRVVSGFSDVYATPGTNCLSPQHKHFGNALGSAFCGIPVDLCFQQPN